MKKDSKAIIIKSKKAKVLGAKADIINQRRKDAKKNIDFDAIKKAQLRMAELKNINRMGLIAVIKELEKW